MQKCMLLCIPLINVLYSRTDYKMTITKYQFLKRQWIFSLLRRLFFPVSPTRHFTQLNYEEQGGYLIRNRICLPFESTRLHPRFYGGVRVAHLSVILVCLSSVCVLYPMLPVSLDCPLLIAHSVFPTVYYVYILLFITFKQ